MGMENIVLTFLEFDYARSFAFFVLNVELGTRAFGDIKK
jgi:hypothetical protein